MAVAGCINAYDCAGCYLTTLQQLQSDNIGVAINYTAPGEYGRRQLDYIKYTDKCGCTCCLTGENELRIVATQGVIKNFTLTNDDTNERVIVKWTDLFGSNWNKTVVRYKTGSYPTSPTDGTLAVEETTQNQYQTNGYSVSGLTDGTTYYFTAFAVSQDGTIIVVQSDFITTDFTTIQTFDFQNNGQLGRNASYGSYTYAGYESNQGLYARSLNSAHAVEVRFIPPSNIFNGQSLKKIRIRMYRNNKNGMGIFDKTGRNYPSILYQRSNSDGTLVGTAGKVNGQYYTKTTNINSAVVGDLLFEIDIEANSISGTIGGQSYTITDNNIGNNMQLVRTTGNFCLGASIWGVTTNCYFRKIEIITR